MTVTGRSFRFELINEPFTLSSDGSITSTMYYGVPGNDLPFGHDLLLNMLATKESSQVNGVTKFKYVVNLIGDTDAEDGGSVSGSTDVYLSTSPFNHLPESLVIKILCSPKTEPDFWMHVYPLEILKVGNEVVTRQTAGARRLKGPAKAKDKAKAKAKAKPRARKTSPRKKLK